MQNKLNNLTQEEFSRFREKFSILEAHQKMMPLNEKTFLFF